MEPTTHRDPERTEPDRGETGRWAAVRRRAVVLLAATAVAAGTLQFAQPTPAVAAPAPAPTLGAGVMQAQSVPYSNVILGKGIRRVTKYNNRCSLYTSTHGVTISLPRNLSPRQVDRALKRVQQGLRGQHLIDLQHLRAGDKRLSGVLRSQGSLFCGTAQQQRRRLQLNGGALLQSLGADVAGAAVYLAVITTMITAGLVFEANPAAAPVTAYYLAFAGCVAGAVSAFVRSRIVRASTEGQIGSALGACLAGAVIGAGVGKIAQQSAVRFATYIRQLVVRAPAEVPGRVAGQVQLARSSASSAISQRVIQAISPRR